MKKKYTKAIKELAKRLPKSKELSVVGKSLMGYDVIRKNLAKDGEVDSDLRYTYKTRELIDINHFNRMKRAYSRSGEKGITEYIQWLDRNNKKLNEMFKDLKLEQVDSNILEIAKKGAKGFWNSILTFLMSFLIAFRTEKEAA